MKNTFRRLIFSLLVLIAFAGLVNLSSCSEDDAKPADKTELIAAIAAAEDLLATTEEGTNDGQFTTETRATLQTAIDAAIEVNDNTKVKQSAVDAAVNSLNAAMEAFNAAKVAPVAEADLIAHWTFNEGTGTTANDISANNLDGTFKTGPTAWGAGFPLWATDRNGDANKAIRFDNGANIEIPYNTKLNPAAMTISLWINPAETNANNRFLGLQSWYAYKFQLQDLNRPFFTVHTSDDAYYDRDAATAVPNNAWHHIAVTFGGGNMVFYIDGEVVKTWDAVPGTGKSIAGTPYNLVIGQDFPTDQYAATTTNFDNDHKIPLEWGGFFNGYLDEVRMYKSVLTGAQIKTIYDREKP